jgi:formylglycine-generating enzyme required for sulfatase activity/serine/threonine protein kinase
MLKRLNPFTFDSSNLIGKTIGHYCILELVGEGGMATVYRARDANLKREVALKVLLQESRDPHKRERLSKRFQREALALAKLDHPNIVKVYDFGEFRGLFFLVMPFISGGSLENFLGKPVPWLQAVRLILPVVQALEHAHRQGIIHRDVKPSNILIAASGIPVLSDFGIARMVEDEGHSRLTSTGVGVGTPEYMSPEQVRGEEVDARSDLYSLGIVFYQLLTGRLPFSASTPMAVGIKHLNEPPPSARRFVPALPGEVEAVLERMLAKKPEARYPDMAELDKVLEALAAVEEQRLRLEEHQRQAKLLEERRREEERLKQQRLDEEKIRDQERIRQRRLQEDKAREEEKQKQLLMEAEIAYADERLRQQKLAEEKRLEEERLEQARLEAEKAQRQESARREQEKAQQIREEKRQAQLRLKQEKDQKNEERLKEQYRLKQEKTHMDEQKRQERRKRLHPTPVTQDVVMVKANKPQKTSRPGRKPARLWLAGAGLLLLGVVGLGTWLLYPQSAQEMLAFFAAPTQTQTDVPTPEPSYTQTLTHTPTPSQTQTPQATSTIISSPTVMQTATNTQVYYVVPSGTLSIGAKLTSPVDGMILVYVPEGKFTMGTSDSSSNGRPPNDSGYPAHKVYLDAFWIDQTEVTNGKYAQCVTAGVCEPPRYSDSFTRSSYFGNPLFNDYPVILVDWGMAHAYCEWAGRRLPTEAEWEKAARGMDGRIYPWGYESPSSDLLNYGGIVGDTVKVGSYPAGTSPYGVLDMAGNVEEWVNDLDTYYPLTNYYTVSPYKNPTGPTHGQLNVIRGEDYLDKLYLRVYDRGGGEPYDTSYTRGFRCVYSEYNPYSQIEFTPTPALSLTSSIGSTQISEADDMVQVYVPEGEFIMGSLNADTQARGDEMPQRTIYLDAFWIDRTEVTRGMFAKCVEAGGCNPSGASYTGLASEPATFVAWSSAADYCAWAGRRLPTEAEWEKAARGTQGQAYPWGNEAPSCDLANFSACSSGLLEVGSLPEGASPYGALDMAGNVAEWVNDWYYGTYYNNIPTANPLGSDWAGVTEHTCRGGSYHHDDIRAAMRYRDTDASCSADWPDSTGFRCAQSTAP